MTDFLSTPNPDKLIEPDANHHIEEEQNICLLAERLIIDRNKQKVGEVIVRKVIETRIVQVPVRREKLIIEEVGAENKQLAEIDLSQGDVFHLEPAGNHLHEPANWDSGLTVTGNFNSPKIASLLLNAIALEQNHGCLQIQVSILVEDEEHQQKYQEWFARCSHDEIATPDR